MRPGRQLQTCRGCGKPTPLRFCPDCTGPNARPYNDPTYQANRTEMIATATECWICGEPGSEDDPLTADHIKAVSAGGDHGRENLRAAHRTCNAARGARI